MQKSRICGEVRELVSSPFHMSLRKFMRLDCSGPTFVSIVPESDKSADISRCT